MSFFSVKRIGFGALMLFTVTELITMSAQAPASDGAALYQQRCSSCHDNGIERAPDRVALGQLLPDRVLTAMETGPMISMATGLTSTQRRSVAEFVTQKSFGTVFTVTPSSEAMCNRSRPVGQHELQSEWNGWGANISNTRFQDTTKAGLSSADVPNLKLRWAFAFPGDLIANAQPTIVGGRVFVGSAGGVVYSLDISTGCIEWFFNAGSPVRAAITVGRIRTPLGIREFAFAGDGSGTAYAIDALNGQVLWKTRVDPFPLARITGSPVLYQNRLYIPVTSGEEAAASSPDYECCRFRGSVVALDATTGKQVWKTFTIDQPAVRTKRNKAGTQLWGPSGATVWSSPAIDERRHALYVTTGNNYSDPSSTMSDAFVAMDLRSGKILWFRQMTPADAYISACRLLDKTNCPDSNGPDFDFASSPILVNLPGGRRALIAGQKSGVVHALDPDRDGAILWQVRVGHGGSAGGVQWGSAADESNVYVALSDLGRITLSYSAFTDADSKRGGGMFALRLESGAKTWYTAPPACGTRPRCSPAQMAAVSAIPGVVFSGSLDGHMRAYSTSDGSIIWDYDTVRAYEAVNGVSGRGGSVDGPGPAIGEGTVVFGSGSHTAGGIPGNVLLAFSGDNK
jgi:polyvinyl alcohol dehydrogenase (cytochrome)